MRTADKLSDPALIVQPAIDGATATIQFAGALALGGLVAGILSLCISPPSDWRSAPKTPTQVVINGQPPVPSPAKESISTTRRPWVPSPTKLAVKKVALKEEKAPLTPQKDDVNTLSEQRV